MGRLEIFTRHLGDVKTFIFEKMAFPTYSILENIDSVSAYHRWAQGGGEKGVFIAGASN